MDWVEARNDGQTTLSIEGLLTYSDSYLYDILYYMRTLCLLTMTANTRGKRFWFYELHGMENHWFQVSIHDVENRINEGVHWYELTRTGNPQALFFYKKESVRSTPARMEL